MRCFSDVQQQLRERPGPLYAYLFAYSSAVPQQRVPAWPISPKNATSTHETDRYNTEMENKTSAYYCRRKQDTGIQARRRAQGSRGFVHLSMRSIIPRCEVERGGAIAWRKRPRMAPIRTYHRCDHHRLNPSTQIPSKLTVSTPTTTAHTIVSVKHLHQHY